MKKNLDKNELKIINGGKAVYKSVNKRREAIEISDIVERRSYESKKVKEKKS